LKKVIVSIVFVVLLTSSAYGLDFSNRNIGETALCLVDTLKVEDQKPEALRIWALGIANDDPVKSYKAIVSSVDREVDSFASELKELPKDKQKNVKECIAEARKMGRWVAVSEILEKSDNRAKLYDIATKTLPENPDEVDKSIKKILTVYKESGIDSEESEDDAAEDATMASFCINHFVAVGWLGIDAKKASLFANKAFNEVIGIEADVRVQYLAKLLPICLFDQVLYEKCRKELVEIPRPKDKVSEDGREYIRSVADVSLILCKLIVAANFEVTNPKVQAALFSGKMNINSLPATDPSKLTAKLKECVPDILKMASSEDEITKMISSTFIMLIAKAGLKEEAKQCWDKFCVPPKDISEGNVSFFNAIRGLYPTLVGSEGADKIFKQTVDGFTDSVDRLHSFITTTNQLLENPLDPNLVDYTRQAIFKADGAETGDKAVMLNSLAYCTNGAKRAELLKESDEFTSKYLEEFGKQPIIYLHLLQTNAKFDTKRAKDNIKQVAAIIGDNKEDKQEFCQTALQLLNSSLSNVPNTDFTIMIWDGNYDN